jgi:hypothetical protein
MDSMLLSGDAALEVFHQFDEPRFESPEGFDRWGEIQNLKAFARDLEEALLYTCEVRTDDSEDMSFLGDVRLPGAAARFDREDIFIRVSNFGRLALIGVTNAGIYDDGETTERIDPFDLRTIVEVLERFGYRPLMEDVLEEPYDGVMPESITWRRCTTWYCRYFSIP